MQIDLSVALDPNKLREYQREQLRSVHSRDPATQEKARQNAQSLLESLLNDVRPQLNPVLDAHQEMEYFGIRYDQRSVILGDSREQVIEKAKVAFGSADPILHAIYSQAEYKALPIGASSVYDSQLQVLWQRVSDKVLALPGVSGSGGELEPTFIVYLAEDSHSIRAQVQRAAAEEMPGIVIDFQKTGGFKPYRK